MTITKKPETNTEAFIASSKSKSVSKPAEEKIRLTYYMTKDMYLRWEKYKLSRLEEGDKITFQSEITRLLGNLFKKANK